MKYSSVSVTSSWDRRLISHSLWQVEGASPLLSVREDGRGGGGGGGGIMDIGTAATKDLYSFSCALLCVCVCGSVVWCFSVSLLCVFRNSSSMVSECFIYLCLYIGFE